MPDKPVWLDRLAGAIQQLESAPDAWVDRSTVEDLLGIGRRRAQQLLAPVASRRVGTSLLALREDLISYLQKVAVGEEAYYEERRRKLLWTKLSESRRDWLEQPPVLVEIPDAEVSRIRLHDFDGLPEGVELGSGSIVVRFSNPEEALKKLMALALAISQNRDAFDQRVAVPDAPLLPD